MRDDTDDIREGLLASVEGLCDAYCPGWIRKGNQGYLAPKSKGDLGSWAIELVGPKRGNWYRHSESIGGGPLQLIAYVLTGSDHITKGTFDEARSFLGMQGRRERSPEEEAQREVWRKKQAERQAEAQRLQEEKERKRLRSAGGVWRDSTAMAGTMGEGYMRLRGVPQPPGGWWPQLRFHPALEWEMGAVFDAEGRWQAPGPTFPAVVGLVQNLAGDPVGITRIFLDPHLSPANKGKAQVDKPKLAMGPTGDGCVRLGGEAPTVGIIEGIESAGGQMAIEGYRFPIWAALGTSGISSFTPPIEVERLLIFPDGDTHRVNRRDGRIMAPPGPEAARKLKERMDAAGVPARMMPRSMKRRSDGLDNWRRINGKDE
jgi:hypothetical protein